MKFFFVLFAMILAVNAKLKYNTFSDNLQSIDGTDDADVDVALPVSSQPFSINLKYCNSDRCEQSCWRNGYRHGMCISSTRCHCYNDYAVVDNVDNYE